MFLETSDEGDDEVKILETESKLEQRLESLGEEDMDMVEEEEELLTEILENGTSEPKACEPGDVEEGDDGASSGTDDGGGGDGVDKKHEEENHSRISGILFLTLLHTRQPCCGSRSATVRPVRIRNTGA